MWNEVGGGGVSERKIKQIKGVTSYKPEELKTREEGMEMSFIAPFEIEWILFHRKENWVCMAAT
jgi:hypothetical protein